MGAALVPTLARKLGPSSPRFQIVNRGLGYSTIDDLSWGLRFALACLIGITLWNSIEILVSAWWFFKRRCTLYFWSVITAAAGTLICATSQVINLGPEEPNTMVALAIGSGGWVLMVTGQSLVLYSRLHLLWDNKPVLRYILAIIVLNAIIMHIPTITVGIICTSANEGSPTMNRLYTILERVEVTMFFAQEMGLSGLYLWRSAQVLKQHGRRMEAEDSTPMTRMLRSLIMVNLVVITLDCSILVLEYLDLYLIQLTVKDFLYSIKLKVELNILNSLRDFFQHTRGLNPMSQNKERRRVQESIQRQWESALHRAFGTVASSGTVTTTQEAEAAEHVEGRQILVPRRMLSSTIRSAH